MNTEHRQANAALHDCMQYYLENYLIFHEHGIDKKWSVHNVQYIVYSL